MQNQSLPNTVAGPLFTDVIDFFVWHICLEETPLSLQHTWPYFLGIL